MPPLPNCEISRDPFAGFHYQPHVSPRNTKMRAERLSPRERGYWGSRFGLDTPYYATPSGFGEWIPLVEWDGVTPPASDVVVLDPSEYAPRPV